MTRTTPIAAAAAALLLISVGAYAAPKKTKSPKPSKAAAVALAPAVELTPGQLEAAGRVYTGDASCEFGEKLHLSPVDGRPGHFKLAYRKASYNLVPEETTTGAVRLEDRRAGIVWLQIPAKSMLMNSRIGQRMADNCLHAEQHAAAVAPVADSSIGIAATGP